MKTEIQIDEFRKQYPMYNHLSDRQVGERLYHLYYEGKMEWPDFAERFGIFTHPFVGLGPGARPMPPTAPPEPVHPLIELGNQWLTGQTTEPLLGELPWIGTEEPAEPGAGILPSLAALRPRPDLVERTAKGYLNKAILDIIERWRPTSQVVTTGKKAQTVNTELNKALDTEVGGLKKWNELSAGEKYKKFPKVIWGFLKGMYGSKARMKEAVAQAKLQAERGAYRFQMPPAETPAEKGIEIGTGLGAFLTQLFIAKKIIPPSSAMSDVAAWELINQLEGGIPGQGAAIRTALGATAKIPTASIPGKIGKTAAESAMFAGVTAGLGGTTEDIIVSGLVPVAFNSWSIYKQQKYLRDVKGALNKSAYARYEADLRAARDPITAQEELIKAGQDPTAKGFSARVQRLMTAKERVAADKLAQEGQKARDVMYHLSRDVHNQVPDAFAPQEQGLTAQQLANELIRRGYNYGQTGRTHKQLRSIKAPDPGSKKFDAAMKKALRDAESKNPKRRAAGQAQVDFLNNLKDRRFPPQDVMTEKLTKAPEKAARRPSAAELGLQVGKKPQAPAREAVAEPTPPAEGLKKPEAPITTPKKEIEAAREPADELEAIRKANPELTRTALRAKNVEDFVHKMAKGRPETVSTEILTNFYNRIKRLQEASPAVGKPGEVEKAAYVPEEDRCKTLRGARKLAEKLVGRYGPNEIHKHPDGFYVVSEIDRPEYGPVVEKIPAEPEKAPLADEKTLLARYDDGEIDMSELIDALEESSEEADIQDAIAEYREAQEADRTEYGMRSGLPEAAEEKIESLIREKVEPRPAPRGPRERFSLKDTSLEAKLFGALHGFEEAESRWAARQKRGLTDEELKAAIAQEFGISGGSSVHGGYSQSGGKNPRFWAESAPGKKPPTLQGKKLITAVRDLMQVPRLGKKAEAEELEIPEAEPVDISKDTPGDLQQRWYDALTKLEETIQKPRASKIQALQMELDNLKGRRKGEELARKNQIRAEIKEHRDIIQGSRQVLESSFIEQNLKLHDEIIRQATVAGLDEEAAIEFATEVEMMIGGRPGIEYTYNKSIQSVIDEELAEWEGAEPAEPEKTEAKAEVDLGPVTAAEHEALEAGVNRLSIRKLRRAITTQDRDELKKWLHTGNKKLRDIFHEDTGVKLPDTEGGTKSAIDEWIEQEKAEVEEAIAEMPKAEPAAPEKAAEFEILNSRGQRYGPTFKTRADAQKYLEKRITAPVARTQFSIEKVAPKFRVGDKVTVTRGDKTFPATINAVQGPNYYGVTPDLTVQEARELDVSAMQVRADEIAPREEKKVAQRPEKTVEYTEKEAEDERSKRVSRVGETGIQPLEEAPPEALQVPEEEGAARGAPERGGEEREGVHRPRPGEGAGLRGAEGDRLEDVHNTSRRGRGTRRTDTSGLNYRITEADEIGKGGAKTKFRNNIDAIEVLKEIEAEGRNATADEQAVLVKYVGWGSMPQVFEYYPREEWASEAKELKDLLTEDEWDAARASTPNAHYTSFPVVKAIWEALQRLGFKGGKIIEPSAGIGHFIGLMPDEIHNKSAIHAVELDSLTGRILKQLYQNTHVHVKGFQDVKYPDNYFDLAISNVPFGNYPIYDPELRKLKFDIHNYFFAKALKKVRPGGLVTFITSKGTMDSKSSTVRTYLSKQANLVAAIRLPYTAFKETAGTEVVADILIFQKREPTAAYGGESFIESEPLKVDEAQFFVNQYFHTHPDHVLGKFAATGSMYRGRELNVEPKEGVELAAQISNILADVKLPESINRRQEAKQNERYDASYSAPAPEHLKENAYTIEKRQILQNISGQLQKIKVPRATGEKMKALIRIRNAARRLIHQQLDPESSDADLKKTRDVLNGLYDNFVRRNGAISKPYNKGLIDDDPDMPLLLSLEDYDPDTKRAKKMAIFSQRTQHPHQPVTHAETAQDALTASLNERGRIDLDYMSQITGESEDKLLGDLGDLIFKDPEQGEWFTRDMYLTGNVRRKLAAAESAAQYEPEYQKNVDALKEIQPKDISATDIDVRLGAPWVGTEIYEQFINELLDRQYDPFKVRFLEADGTWTVDGVRRKHAHKETSEFGTVQVNAANLIEQALNLQLPTVTKKEGDKRVTDQEATALARAQQEKVKQQFRGWIFDDPDRREMLVRQYNDEYNNIIFPQYDGSHLTLPGSNSTIQLRPYQKNLTWRMIVSGNTLADHVVGAGKTWAATAALMEMRRLGLKKKPLIVAPKHLADQWARDFLKLYPSARILPTTAKDFEPKNRQTLMNRIATGDWDAVIVTYESFEKIPMNPDLTAGFFKEHIDSLETEIREAKAEQGDNRSYVKQLEKAKARLEALLHRLQAIHKKDQGPFFDELGIDALVVDESQAFKNLYFHTKMTRVPGIPTNVTQRSFDMYLKTKFLNDSTGNKGVYFLTGTPITNSITEMFTLQRYLQPSLLDERRIGAFDAWAQNFGDTEERVEVTPEGRGFRVHRRFTKFTNVGELAQMFRLVTDVITNEDTGVDVPKQKGGKHIAIDCPEPPGLKEFVSSLVQRAEAIRAGRVRPWEDNMLKVTGEGRKAALDMRLVSDTAPDFAESKVNRCIQEVFDIWKKTTAEKALQVIWCDLSTPKPGQWSIYSDIREKLSKKGIPREEIAFVHEAKDAKLEALYKKARQGRIRVLLASTAKMGTGANVQDRFIAAHHLDAPWRPADVEQRDGRIIRYGNKYPEVSIDHYVTKGSFDAYMWQTLQTKAEGIGRLLKASSTQREIENIDEMVLSYAELKALSASDPRIMEVVQLESDLARLQAMERGHQEDQWTKESRLRWSISSRHADEKRLERLKQDQEAYNEAKLKAGDKLDIEIDGKKYEKHKEAGEAIDEYRKSLSVVPKYPQRFGKAYGFTLKLGYRRGWFVELIGSETYEIDLGDDPVGNARRITSRLDGIGSKIEEVQKWIKEATEAEAALRQSVGKAFEKADELREKAEHLALLKAQLNLDRRHGGFVRIPRLLEDIVAFAEAMVRPAEARFAKLGLTGKKLVVRARKAEETAQIRAGKANEIMHKVTRGLTRHERADFGYAVNYVAWQRDPRPKAKKKRGYRLRRKPTSAAQRKAAEMFLKLADAARREYESMGGEVKIGGVPWPQRFTAEGLKLYAEAMGAVNKKGEPNFGELRENYLVQEMIEDGIAENEGHAFKILKKRKLAQKRPIYAYMEREKDPLPAKYLIFDADKILGQDFWKQMYKHVELARQFGVEHYRAHEYLGHIKREFDAGTANEVEKWWNRVIGKQEPRTKTQEISRRLAHGVGQYQALKLSPLTSVQNFFQRWLSAMEWGPIAVLRAQIKAWTPKGRSEARESGAIPFDPFEAGLIADLKTGENRSFARAWIELIGMGITERGNNYTAALTATRSIVNDFDKLKNRPGPAGQLVRNILSLGGESQGAIKRRLQRHGINWKRAVGRGFLTIDELHLASLREAKSKHFRTDYFTTPTWWQNSPWGRQWAKYKIPFSYNMMTKIWTLAAKEAAHGNFRALFAFLLVATITGEIYHLWRKLLLGEDRADVPILKRLWEDIIDGGAVGLFAGLMFGRDIVEKLSNMVLGVSGSTAKRVVQTAEELYEAPEHTDEHLLRFVEREIPTIKYINQATWEKEEHIRQYNRRKIREAEEDIIKKERDLYHYYDDLYDAALANDKKAMVFAARKAIEHGATRQSLIQAMEAKRPSKTPYKKRPELGEKLSDEQKRTLRKLEKEHDIAVARVRGLAGKDFAIYVASLIKQSQNTKLPLGERHRAVTKLKNLGIGQAEYSYYERTARQHRRRAG